MPILHQHHPQDLDLPALTDPSLSWGAKGLYVFLATRPFHAQMRLTDLARASLEESLEKDAPYGTYLYELEEAGYVVTSKWVDGEERLGQWEIFRDPLPQEE